MKTLTSFLLAWLFSVGGSAQNNCTFLTLFPELANQTPLDAEELPTGDFLLKTQRLIQSVPSGFGASFTEARVNFKGDKVAWDSIVAPTRETVVLPDGFVSVLPDTLPNAFLIRRFDENGLLVWEKSIRDSLAQKVKANGILEDNGYFYIYGASTHIWNPSTYAKPFLMKTDLQGNVLWQKIWWDENEINSVRFLTKTEAGNWYFEVYFQYAYLNKRLIKTDTSGVVKMKSTFGTSSVGQAPSESPDGKLVLLPFTTGLSHAPGIAASFKCLDAKTGNQKWWWNPGSIPNPNLFASADAGAMTLPDGFLVTFTISPIGQFGVLHLHVVRLDTLGKMLWHKEILSPSVRAFPAQRTSDGGFLFAGKQGDVPFLLKTDSLCNFDPVSCSNSQAASTLVALVADSVYLWPGEALVFDLQFENWGFSPAKDVELQDNLGAYFQVSENQILESSHPVELTVDSVAGTARFLFKDINLPPLILDSVGGRGHVRFSVKIKQEPPPGNEACHSFYTVFDENEPVWSNFVCNKIKQVSLYAVDIAHCWGDPYPNLPPIDTIDFGDHAIIAHIGIYDLSYLSKTDSITLQSGSVFLGQTIVADTILHDTVPSLNYPCPTAVTYIVKIISAANELPESSFDIFPNPAAEEVFVKMRELEGRFRVSLVNAFGQSVGVTSSHDLGNFSNFSSLRLDLRGLPSGQYFLKIENQDGRRFFKKLVKN